MPTIKMFFTRKTRAKWIKFRVRMLKRAARAGSPIQVTVHRLPAGGCIGEINY